MSDEPLSDDSERPPLIPPPLPLAALPVDAPLPSVPPPPPPPLPTRSRRVRWIVIGIVSLVVLIGGAASVVVWVVSSGRSAAQAETAEQKFREAREAFAAGAPSASASVGTGSRDVAQVEQVAIEAAFARLAAAVRQNNSSAAALMFDADRLTEELRDTPALAKATRLQRQGFATGIRTRDRNSAVSDIAVMGWARYTVGRIKDLGHGDALAFVRHRDDVGRLDVVRWWWHKSGGVWRVYDYEEMAANLRNSRAIAAAMSNPASLSTGTLPPWSAAAKQLPGVFHLLAAEDYDGAEKVLKSIETVTFPPEHEATQLFATSALQLARRDYRGTLATLDRAEALRPDTPQYDRFRATAHYWLAEHDQAVSFAKRYDQAMGPDADNLMTLALSLRALDRREEAAAAHRAALDDDPNASHHLAELAIDSSKSEKADVAARFRKSYRTPAQFDDLVGGLRKQPDGTYDEAAMADVIAAFRERNAAMERLDGSSSAGANALADAAEAEMHHRAGRHQRAAAVAREAMLLGVPDNDAALIQIAPNAVAGLRAWLQRVYFESMYAMHKSVQAYRDVPDRAAAFLRLAELADADNDTEELLRLIEARRTDAPGEAWPHVYEGHVHTKRKAYDLADAAYATAAKKVKTSTDFDEQAQRELRFHRLLSRFNLGQSTTALKDLPPAWDAFRQLAYMHAGRNDSEGLAKLISAYAARYPENDPALERWQAELKWMQKDFRAAADLYLAFIKRRDAEPKAKNEKPRLGLPPETPEPDKSYVEYHLIDSLLRSGRSGTAMSRAKLAVSEYGSHFELLLVHAYLGNVSEAMAEMKVVVEDEATDLQDVYDDPILGPLLREEKFAPLRAAYPLPAPSTRRSGPLSPVRGGEG